MNKYLDIRNYLYKFGELFSNLEKQIIKIRRIKYWKNLVTKRLRRIEGKPLDTLQKNNIKEFYSYYTMIDTVFHDFYYRTTGVYDVKFIPDDLYYTVIEPFYNNWEEAKYFDNKAFYRMFFHDATQPETIAARCGGIWTDENFNSIKSFDSVIEKVSQFGCFLKKATDSEGGAGVKYFAPEMADMLKDEINSTSYDVVIQKPIKQSNVLNKLNESSVNTIRILSLVRGGEVKIYSSVLRMGINGAKVDNASSGGITCGITDSGKLKSVAYSASGQKYLSHPTSGVKFDTITIPNFESVKNLVKRLAPRLGHFKLLSWDVAIDSNDRPVLIEVNLWYGQLDFHQLNNGPVFGIDTESILKEVLASRK